eukprot:CAMPEP_0174342838 /NCGR_PEP_ID=MMETSP0810-20121108/26462_1 /TAXON_ID=73025 ORGANISM="Eutreptiella gymnastica-like, Strain CCMP1594" /NCGR_SAMPLE_ID=MMETSP0810 /ASSEMBLY_ACC=CAM_ASM_000659 /LENGTH=200 /DNA_ID=CAMNT_0015465175 /DNA_START=155 /DNA_END=757 /DNA_ORIENTATION=-
MPICPPAAYAPPQHGQYRPSYGRPQHMQPAIPPMRTMPPNPHYSLHPAPAMQGPPKTPALKADSFKTAICQHWQRSAGLCPFAANCAFAHGEAELNPRKRALEPAPGYGGYGGYASPRGPAPDLKRKRTELYKTSLCAHFRESGLCPFAENCSFAHGEMELRSATQGDFTEADCTEADFTEADFTEADYTEAVEGVPPAW